MGKVGKGKRVVSVGLLDEFVDVIDSRADALRWSRSEFVLSILEDWKARGCPPVSEQDRVMQLAKAASAKPAKKTA